MTHDSALFRSLLDALPFPLFWKDRHLRYLGCNTAYARLAQLAHPGQVVGMDDYQLPVPREDAERYRAVDEEVLRTGETRVNSSDRLELANGEHRWSQTTKVPLRNEHGEVIGVLGLIVDISVQHEAQEKLRFALAAGEAARVMLQAQVAEREMVQRALALSELRLRSAIRGSDAALCSIDARGIMTFTDGGGLSSMGLRPGAHVGLSVFDVYKDNPDVLEQCRRGLQGEAFSGIAHVRGVYFENRFTPVFDAAGGFQGTIVVAIDVTGRVRAQEQLEAELDRTRAQLLEVERLASLGTLAAGVGHELRNISTVLDSLRDSFTESARDGVPPGRDELEELGRVCAHVATHGRHLMDLGRPGDVRVERVDLRELVSGTLAMLRTAGVTRYVRVSAEEPEAPVWVRASRTRLEQVLLNLVRNAADALESVRERPAEVRVRVSEDSESRQARCRVEDTGVGIPPGQLEAIFEPWFTTKPPGRGTGLGLPVVRNLLREAGGELSVESRVGHGSAFTFWLPLAA